MGAIPVPFDQTPEGRLVPALRPLDELAILRPFGRPRGILTGGERPDPGFYR